MSWFRPKLKHVSAETQVDFGRERAGKCVGNDLSLSLSKKIPTSFLREAGIFLDMDSVYVVERLVLVLFLVVVTMRTLVVSSFAARASGAGGALFVAFGLGGEHFV